MNFIYHRVPRNMAGTILYPLNELRDVNESVYQEHVKKYEGREHLTEARIPLLGNCLWNDVLFFSAVHPSIFWSEYEAVGFNRSPIPSKSFEFDVQQLDHSKLAVLMKMEMNRPDEYEPFDPSRMDRYSIIPQETHDYWRIEKEAGNMRPLLYMHIPHILYRGSLDTSLANVLES